jgi:hypothetical protein
VSKIVAFRDRIIKAIQDLYPDMNVEWYDGLFDEQDIADWTLKTPCARVAVMNGGGEHEVTGEINGTLRCVCVIIDENSRAALDGDARAWEYVENIAILANLNTFGDRNAAPATKVKFKRISQPVLRREGVAVGVVEWESSLTIGRNRVRERDFFYDSKGQMITKVPQTKVTARGFVHNAAGFQDNEELDVTPEEDR